MFILHMRGIDQCCMRGVINANKELNKSYISSDIAMIHSLFDAELMQHYVHGEIFSQWQPMVQPAWIFEL